MPELPEVETVRRQLEAALVGGVIRAVDVWQSDKEQPKGESFCRVLIGKTIYSIERRGKLLLWRFLDDALAIHLKMTGKLLLRADRPLGDQRHKHDRLAFAVERDDKIVYLVWNDVRRFGYLKYLANLECIERIVSEYGLEPLVTPVEALAEALDSKSDRSVKATLLDQSVIAGVGNIYADEACFAAGIHPARRLKSLALGERQALAAAIRDVLERSLALQGTSAHTYVDTRGEKGSFVGKLQVYGRTGKPCVRCGAPIVKSVLAGRGTHTCLRCQPKKRFQDK